MSALKPARRPVPARVLAQKVGVSERTIKRYIAEPRPEYDARTEARHDRIRKLRAEGLSYRAIAAELHVAIGTVHYALNKSAPRGG